MTHDYPLTPTAPNNGSRQIYNYLSTPKISGKIIIKNLCPEFLLHLWKQQENPHSQCQLALKRLKPITKLHIILIKLQQKLVGVRIHETAWLSCEITVRMLFAEYRQHWTSTLLLHEPKSLMLDYKHAKSHSFSQFV
jgi:hypothetical protein